jgi:hypothetical protein
MFLCLFTGGAPTSLPKVSIRPCLRECGSYIRGVNLEKIDSAPTVSKCSIFARFRELNSRGSEPVNVHAKGESLGTSVLTSTCIPIVSVHSITNFYGDVWTMIGSFVL